MPGLTFLRAEFLSSAIAPRAGECPRLLRYSWLLLSGKKRKHPPRRRVWVELRLDLQVRPAVRFRYLNYPRGLETVGLWGPLPIPLGLGILLNLSPLASSRSEELPHSWLSEAYPTTLTFRREDILLAAPRRVRIKAGASLCAQFAFRRACKGAVQQPQGFASLALATWSCRASTVA